MNGWDEFLAFFQAARPRLEDRFAPVALICLAAEPREDGVINVYPEADAAVLWPASFATDARGPLLLRLAEPYRTGTVLRSRNTTTDAASDPLA